MKKLLVGYDGSGPAREAALMAGRLAKQLGANVTVLTVGEIAPLIVAPTGMFIREAQERDFVPIAEEGAEIVEALGVAAESQVEIGDPATQVVEAVRRAGVDLVVMGHRGMGGVAGLVLGSVAKKVAEESSCPVLVVIGNAPDTIRKILVAIDGSEHSRRAVEIIVDLASAFDAEVTIIHVLDPTELGEATTEVAKRKLRAAFRERGSSILADAAELFRRAGVAHETVLAEGRPSDVVSERVQSSDYDLVAIGRRGLGGVKSLMLGSVSDEVLRKVKRPVLLVGERATTSLTT
ncbi:MAG: universal stress protein [Chloroflexota bacterium]